MEIAFKKAVKYESKGRLALIGPSGSGKTWTMLTAARALVGPKGKIAAIDTEHGSMRKYADEFDFDVFELSSFSPDSFLAALHAAEKAGYDAFCCDSLSHFWVGKDGALEYVDMAAKKYKDNMGGWKEFRPHERAMVDAMIASPMHVLVTMRTKTEYQEQVNPNTGKKQRVKIGLAPVQREGLEYEFDFVGYMDEENTLITDKTRCKAYNQRAISKPSLKDFEPFAAWLKGSPQEKPVNLTVHAPEPKAAPAPAPAAHISNGKAAEPVVTHNMEGVRVITPAQRTRLFALQRNSKKTEAQLREFLKFSLNIDSSKDIPMDAYDEVCAWVMNDDVVGGA